MENCENCHQPISVEKINSHYAYCLRNFKKCTQCSVFYDINQKEDHDQQYHTYQNCIHCNKRLNAKDITQHQEGCMKRPIECDYCQNSIDSIDFERHHKRCGARTEYCNTCKEYVMLKDLDKHVYKCYPKVQNKFRIERLDGQQAPMKKTKSELEDEEDWELQEAIKQSLNH